MSLPIAVAPSPARSAAPGPRPTGGSAEDFAAAVREAEAPGAERAQPSNSRPTSSQPTTSQPKDTQVDRADDQTADRIAMGALLGSPDVSAARVPIGILVPDASTDQLLGAGDTTAQKAPAAEDGALSVPMPASAAADAAVSAAASSGAQHVRADAAVAVAAPGQAPGTAAPSTAAADSEASADTAALGAGSMPARGSATAAGGTMPQPGQGEADRGGDADAITGISAPRTPGSPLAASTLSASSSGAHDPSAAALAAPYGAALTRQGSGAAQVATGTPAVAESAAAPSAATAASAPLPAATAAEAPAAGSARPALLPQLSGPVIALARSPQGQHSITLTVSPENLGPVTVRAHIVGSSIRLELHSPSDAGRDALRVILADLRRDLSVAAPGASVDVSARDSGSSPDPQARPDAGRSETQTRADAQARGDQQRAHTGAAEPRQGPRPASVGQTQPTGPTDPSSSHSRIDVYA
ncbi:flagellar hook-length control protein FliK [Microbacterium sp. NPDC055312]